MALNKVMLIGNAGRDPEVRYIESMKENGNVPKVASFTLATSEKFRDRNGELRENTEWHNIVAWRGLADICEKYVRKGTQLYVEGRIRTRSWTDQSGMKKYVTEILADSLQLLGRRPDNEADRSQGGSAYQNYSRQGAGGTGASQPAGGSSYAGGAENRDRFRQTAPQPAVSPANPEEVDDLPF